MIHTLIKRFILRVPLVCFDCESFAQIHWAMFLLWGWICSVLWPTIHAPIRLFLLRVPVFCFESNLTRSRFLLWAWIFVSSTSLFSELDTYIIHPNINKTTVLELADKKKDSWQIEPSCLSHSQYKSSALRNCSYSEQNIHNQSRQVVLWVWIFFDRSTLSHVS